jgi:chromosome segregation protein
MDKGAHYHKCDFQVHTPRDINWSGQAAVSEDERKAYAKELISACRAKGIDAIAITDHHDFVFFPHIKKAAAEELISGGDPVPANKRILVFPGLELTFTAPACQAILILDSNFSRFFPLTILLFPSPIPAKLPST